MKHIKNISIWIIGFVICIISSVSIMYMFDDTFYRIEETSIPENPTAFAMGGFFGAAFGVIFNIVVYIIFLILIVALKSEVKFNNLLFDKNENVAQKVIHIIGYGLIVIFVFNYTKSLLVFHDIILSEIIFYLTSISAAVFYIIISISFFNKRQLSKLSGH